MRGPYLNVWQGLVILGLVVVSFGILITYTQENNRDARRRIEQIVYENCENRRINTVTTNTRNSALAQIERANKFIDDEVRKKRVDIYSVMLEIPNCGSRP